MNLFPATISRFFRTGVTTALGPLLVLVSLASAFYLVRAVLRHGPGDVREARKPDAPALPEPEPFGAEPAKGKFLVASRDLDDPRFQETVVLLIAFDDRGAVGLVINRPTEVLLAEMLPDMAALMNRPDVVYYGGPVERRRMLLLIRSGDSPGESAPVFDGVYVSSSRTVLERLAGKPKKGEQFRVFAGYAGWARGQLEGEIARGDWHVIRADAKTLFDKKADDIWPELIRRSSAIHVRHFRRALSES